MNPETVEEKQCSQIGLHHFESSSWNDSVFSFMPSGQLCNVPPTDRSETAVNLRFQLSSVAESSKEMIQSGANSCEASQLHNDSDTVHHVTTALPLRMDAKEGVTLNNIHYRAERCSGVIYRVYPLISDHCSMIIKVGYDGDEERKIYVTIKHLLSNTAGLMLPVDCYKFTDGYILTYTDFVYTTWRDIEALVSRKGWTLEEETYAIFVFELLKTLRHLQTAGIPTGTVSVDNLLFYDDLNAYRREKDNLMNASVSFVKMINFQNDKVRRAGCDVTLKMCQRCSDKFGTANAVYRLIFGKPLPRVKSAFVGCVPYHWNQKVWHHFFNAFLKIDDSAQYEFALEEFVKCFYNIAIANGVALPLWELEKLSSAIRDPIKL